VLSDLWLWSFVILTLAGLAALLVAAPSSLSLASTVATLFAAQPTAPGAAVPVPVLTVAQALAPARCQLVQGFALLEAYVGPSVVGACLENEWFNAASGQAEQRTTGGLLVWRKGENLLAFTDGHRTWLKRPEGLYHRLNSQRFCWERDADPARCERSGRPL
jgi:hypothetical protein